MNIIDSYEIPEAGLEALIEQRNGKFYVHAHDKDQSWTTQPIDTIEEAWGYIDKWFAVRGLKRINSE